MCSTCEGCNHQRLEASRTHTFRVPLLEASSVRLPGRQCDWTSRTRTLPVYTHIILFLEEGIDHECAASGRVITKELDLRGVRTWAEYEASKTGVNSTRKA